MVIAPIWENAVTTLSDALAQLTTHQISTYEMIAGALLALIAAYVAMDRAATWHAHEYAEKRITNFPLALMCLSVVMVGTSAFFGYSAMNH